MTNYAAHKRLAICGIYWVHSRWTQSFIYVETSTAEQLCMLKRDQLGGRSTVTEVRTADDHYWHVARTDQGVYIRIGPNSEGITVPLTVARELGFAVREVAGE